MINQGFVTDSDTEKELKKWQQARATAVDEDKLKRQYKNRLNNAQGQHFEREILAGCRMYENHGIATIDKTPEPFRVCLLYTSPSARDRTRYRMPSSA